MKYLVSDIISKFAYKLNDYILKSYWLIRIGSLGNGSFIRSKTRIIGNPKRIKIGHHFKIYENCLIAIGKGEILIGNDGLLGVGTYINCGNEKLIIGDGVAIAPFCKIFTFSHHYASNVMTIESYKTGDVIIKNNVLIGANTIILPGVTIGNDSIIAAGSIVNLDIPPGTIYGGAPAKFIKMRNNENSDRL
jgi:acetyltransferase-like isoleucine patch superfamily enzyme